MRAWLSIFIAAMLTGPASAQAPSGRPDPEAARALSANYELADAEGERKCPLTLEARPGATGFALSYDRPRCVKLFTFLAEVAGWLPGTGGSIRLVRGNGRTVAEFTEGIGGTYEAIRDGDAVYFLTNLQFVEPELAQPSELVGEWELARPGGPPLCRIVLTEDTIEEGFALKVQPGCDAAISRFDPTAWRIERSDVLIVSKTGDRLRFGKQEGGGWAKVPENPRPLTMTKPQTGEPASPEPPAPAQQ